MTNCEITFFEKKEKIEVEPGEIIIRIKSGEDHGPSGSGKTNIVGTTHGFTNISAGSRVIGLSVNAVTKK